MAALGEFLDQMLAALFIRDIHANGARFDHVNHVLAHLENDLLVKVAASMFNRNRSGSAEAIERMFEVVFVLVQDLFLEDFVDVFVFAGDGKELILLAEARARFSAQIVEERLC